MTGPILKLQYKQVGDKNLQGGIATCFFFVSKSVIATSAQILNIRKPVKPYRYAQCFLIFDGRHVELPEEPLREFPHLNLVFFRLKESFNVQVPELPVKWVAGKEQVQSIGYDNNKPVEINFIWKDNRIILQQYDIKKRSVHYSGVVVQRFILDENSFSGEEAVKFKKAKAFEVDYAVKRIAGENKATSGSAVFLNGTNTVVGMIAAGSEEKRNSVLMHKFYAISSAEIFIATLKTPFLKPWWKFW